MLPINKARQCLFDCKKQRAVEKSDISLHRNNNKVWHDTMAAVNITKFQISATKLDSFKQALNIPKYTSEIQS